METRVLLLGCQVYKQHQGFVHIGMDREVVALTGLKVCRMSVCARAGQRILELGDIALRVQGPK